MRPEVFRVEGEGANAELGRVRWAPAKSLWFNGHLAVTLVLGPLLFSPSALVVCLGLTYLTLLLGHSVGMHRMLIHRTFDAHPWVDGFLIYLGVVVGMAGPFGLLRVHDIRDWAQRLPTCHDFFSHRRSLWQDAFWNLNCRFEFENPPLFVLEPASAQNAWYRLLERTWMLQQLLPALLLYWMGGWSWVVWGVSARVVLSVAGHWTVTYVTHNPGPGNWLVPDAGVQASNLPGWGLLTMGECWHNNHHAFPESARIGFEGQLDPGWWVIRALEGLGLASNVGLPRDQGDRDDIERTAPGQFVPMPRGRRAQRES
ncbi:MAG: acyl-CoA desaturase [Pseudomonadota bacterium]